MFDEVTLGSTASVAVVGISGSSGIVSLDNGRLALLLESLFGDFALVAPVAREVGVVEARLLVGLAVFVREERVEGRLAGAVEDAPPTVVRLVLSELGSVRAVLELVVVPPRVVVLDEGRLFSSAAAAVASSLLPAGLRVEEVVDGRVGGLLIVLPEVREDRVLARAVEVEVEGEAGLREAVLVREEVVDGFFVSSAFAGAFAPGVVFLSILAALQLFTLQLRPSRLNLDVWSCGNRQSL